MGMYHSTSGKHGFGGYHVRCDTEFTKEQAKALLEAEERLRASKQTQARCALTQVHPVPSTAVLADSRGVVVQIC